ncbi:hypothetical protein SDC9_173553 [bioreactor metagenome]|uniref:Uncharacterized protein n=1 Tax=bioreactor metagenome TaxID=1076179 RepID=A0A645GJW5_9ZZZZ
MDLALRVHRLEQGVVGVDAALVGESGAGRHAADVKPGTALELAPEAAAAVLGQAGQILVRAGKAKRHIGQCLALERHKALLRQRLGQGLGKVVVVRTQQGRCLRQILDDGEHGAARHCAQLPGQRGGIHALGQGRILADRAADEVRFQPESGAQPAPARQRQKTRLERVICSGQQIEGGGECWRRPFLQQGKAFWRMVGELLQQATGFELVAEIFRRHFAFL